MTAIEKLAESRYRVRSSVGADVRSNITRFAYERNLALVGLKQEKNSLESVFSELTNPGEKS